MSKQVIAILPGDVVKTISVPDENNYADFIGDNGSKLGLPIEIFILDECEYNIARYDENVSDQRIEQAIRTGQ